MSERRGKDGRMLLTTRDVALIRELRYGDGLTAAKVAGRVGCSAFSVLKYAPGRPGTIDNASLREAFVASGRSASDVARALGWLGNRGGSPDTSRVRRALGLLDQTSMGRGGLRYRSRMKLIDAEVAARMAEAIGVAPWEVGA